MNFYRLGLIFFTIWFCAGCQNKVEDPVDQNLIWLEKKLSTDRWQEYLDFQNQATFERTVNSIFVGESSTYNFFLDHLPFMGQCLRALKIRPYQISAQKDQKLYFSDQGRFSGYLIQWADGSQQRVYRVHVQGEAPLGFEVSAELLFWLNFKPMSQDKIENQLKVWVRLSGMTSVLAKIILPVAGSVFDRKLEEVLIGAQELSSQVFKSPQDVLEALSQSSEINKNDLLEFEQFLQKIGKLDDT